MAVFNAVADHVADDEDEEMIDDGFAFKFHFHLTLRLCFFKQLPDDCALALQGQPRMVDVVGVDVFQPFYRRVQRALNLKFQVGPQRVPDGQVLKLVLPERFYPLGVR